MRSFIGLFLIAGILINHTTGLLHAQPVVPKTLTKKLPAYKEVFVLFPHSKDVQKIKVQVEGLNRYTYQEDILIDTSQVVHDTSGQGKRMVDMVLKSRRLQYRQGGVTTMSAGSGLYGWGRWDGAVIPYTIRSDIPSSFRKDIDAAIAHINSKTNLCVRQRKPGEVSYVEFISTKHQSFGGRSALGKTGGRQTIELDIEDTVYKSIANTKTVIHEILHAAGIIHEHSRSDRDNYVEVIWENVDPWRVGDLLIDPFSNNTTTYDFTSIMHYKPHFGGKLVNGETLTTLRAKGKNIIDPSSKLTEKDIEGINAIYRVKADCNYSLDEDPAGNLINTGKEIIENITYSISGILNNVNGKVLAEGTYYIKCYKGGKYLKARQDGGSCEANNGSWVVLEGKGSGTCDNRFQIKKYGVGYTMKCVTKYAEVNLETMFDNNVRLTMWRANLPENPFNGEKNHNINQQWLFYKLPGHDNLYIIQNVGSGKVLDANDNCITENDCKVKQYTPKNNDATQVWVLEKAE